MRFWVRVPVLSEQMTLALPRVSTAGRRRTMARLAAMRRTPAASVMVTTAGRPSGMAATARLTAIRNISSGSTRWNRPMMKITKQMASAPMPRVRPTRASRCWSGVCGAAWLPIMRAMRPTCVRIPVSTTRPLPCPAVTAQLENIMLCRSPSGVPSGKTASAAFSEGTLSPVRALSSALRSTAATRRRSAGTRSPALSRTRSPGTSCGAGTTASFPPRTTRARGLEMRRRASSAFSARLSCTMPVMAFTTTMARMMMESI